MMKTLCSAPFRARSVFCFDEREIEMCLLFVGFCRGTLFIDSKSNGSDDRRRNFFDWNELPEVGIFLTVGTNIFAEVVGSIDRQWHL